MNYLPSLRRPRYLFERFVILGTGSDQMLHLIIDSANGVAACGPVRIFGLYSLRHPDIPPYYRPCPACERKVSG